MENMGGNKGKQMRNREKEKDGKHGRKQRKTDEEQRKSKGWKT